MYNGIALADGREELVAKAFAARVQRENAEKIEAAIEYLERAFSALGGEK